MSGSNSSVRDAAARAEAVGLTVHSMPAPELQTDARRTRIGRIKMLLVLLVCAAPVVASYFSYFVLRPQARSNYGSLILPTRSLPALPLRTLDGKPVDARVAAGPVAAAGASARPTAPAGCQKRLYMQRQLREMLGRERDRIDKLWLVTDGAEARAGPAHARSMPTRRCRCCACRATRWPPGCSPRPAMRSRTICTWSTRWASG